MSSPPTPYPYQKVQPREKPMAVLALGLSRTGTLSTYTALEILGYQPYHMMENVLNQANGHPKLWDTAIRAKYKAQGKRWEGADFERMLWRYDAVTDAPTALFPEEMVEAYPDAKVVLSRRDPEKWARSCIDTFGYFLKGPFRWFYLRNFDRNYGGCWYNTTLDCLMHWSGGDIYNVEAYKKYGITKHNALVKSIVPKENLLEWHPSEGWEPLCEFLGKDVPDVEFPNVNEGAGTKLLLDKVLLMRCIISMGEWVLWLAPGVVAGVGVWWYYTTRG